MDRVALKTRWDLIRFLFKEELQTSRWFLSSFSALAIRWAIFQARREKFLPALGILFKAWRASKTFGFPDRGKRVMWDILGHTCFDEDALRPIARNELLQHFRQSSAAKEIRHAFHSFPPQDRVRLRFPRTPDDPERQGNLIVLKPYDSESGERGVLLLKYGESFLWFAALFDLARVAERYVLVLEPCWAGYQDWRFLLFLGSDLTCLVQAPHPLDFEFIRSLNGNLTPIRLGAGDWVDPSTFAPLPGSDPEYDLVMVSAWNPLKRHHEFFQALRRLRSAGYQDLRVALVGAPTVWSRDIIERMVAKFGLSSTCEIFEMIPHGEVARIVASSRAFVLTSRQEGANKALYEALFCDTPVLVYSKHRSVNPDHIVDQVGVPFDAGQLHHAIETVLSDPDRYSPRAWAIQNTGWPVATARLDRAIGKIEAQAGRPWTYSIEPKKNAPHLRYTTLGTYKDFGTEYNNLRDLMIASLN